MSFSEQAFCVLVIKSCFFLCPSREKVKMLLKFVAYFVLLSAFVGEIVAFWYAVTHGRPSVRIESTRVVFRFRLSVCSLRRNVCLD